MAVANNQPNNLETLENQLRELSNQKTIGKPLALDMVRNSVAVSTAFNLSLHN